MIPRRDFITLLGGAAAAWPLGAGAQQAVKVYRIGILETNSLHTNAANFDALRKGMMELGYIEGKTLSFEYRSADGRNERFPDLVAELLRLKVDLIVTRSTPAVLAVKAAMTTIPVVMAATANPVGDGIVASLARPGGNITGLSSFHSELSTKRLEMLREMIPRIALVGTLSDPSNPVTPGQEEDVRSAAQPFGIATRFLGARSREELEPAFEAAAREKVGKSPTNRRPRWQVSVARNLCIQGIRGCGRADDIWSELPRPLSTRRSLCRQDIEGHRQAGWLTDRTACQI
jgi:putative ABC transport system substrate-binding protein